MSDELLGQLPQMSVEELWNLFDMHYRDESIVPKDIYNVVKFGKNIQFDIRQWIRSEHGDQRYFKEEPTNNKMYYISKKILCSLPDFDNELDMRKAIMRKALYDHYSDHEPDEARN